MKLAVGIALSFALGVCCRVFDIPVPSPPFLSGALLVLAMTLGYSGANAVLNRLNKPATTAHLCGGPTGRSVSARGPTTARVPEQSAGRAGAGPGA